MVAITILDFKLRKFGERFSSCRRIDLEDEPFESLTDLFETQRLELPSFLTIIPETATTPHLAG
jgi:hypothetical protein